MWHAIFDSCTSSPFFFGGDPSFEAKCWMSADSQVLHKSLRIQRPSELKTDPFEIVFDGHMCHMYSNGQKFIKFSINWGRSIHFHKDFFNMPVLRVFPQHDDAPY